MRQEEKIKWEMSNGEMEKILRKKYDRLCHHLEALRGKEPSLSENEQLVVIAAQQKVQQIITGFGACCGFAVFSQKNLGDELDLLLDKLKRISQKYSR